MSKDSTKPLEAGRCTSSNENKHDEYVKWLAQHRTQEDTNDRVRRLPSKMSLLAGVLVLLLGNFLGGAYVTYHGPNVPLVWDGLGTKGYVELLESNSEGVQTHEDDVAIHENDVAMARAVQLEKQAKRKIANAKRKIEIGKIAVIKSQNEWLWNSHNTLNAIMDDDESRFATEFPKFLQIATKIRVTRCVELILTSHRPLLVGYLTSNHPDLVAEYDKEKLRKFTSIGHDVFTIDITEEQRSSGAQ